MGSRLQSSDSCAGHQVVDDVECPDTDCFGNGIWLRNFFCGGAELDNLTIGECLVPEANLRGFYRLFLAVIVGKEEGTGTQLPVRGIG